MARMAEERVESQGFYEMLWDCEFCDTKGLLAKSQRHCANCGAKQNADKRYFPTEGQKQRLDGHQYEGSDRYCPNCNAPQGAKGTNCTNCGAAMDGSKEVRGVVTPAPPPKKTNWRPIIIILGVIVLLIVAIWYFFLRTKEVKMTVTAHRWERSIGVDEFRDVQESAWRNEVPADARMVTCHREQRSTKQVQDGEECHIEKVDKKDGTFEELKKCKPKYRSEPVDDDKCNYNVRRWKEVDRVKTSGSGLTPAWPTNGVPPPTNVEAVGTRRPGKRTETLMLDFGKQTCEVSDAAWRKYSDNSSYKLEVRARSGDIVCKSL
jgi:hypothetical protein